MCVRVANCSECRIVALLAASGDSFVIAQIKMVPVCGDKLGKKGLIQLDNSSSCSVASICTSCQKAKAHKLPFLASECKTASRIE